MALNNPISCTGNIFGRNWLKNKNISAVHFPTPLIVVKYLIASSSLNCFNFRTEIDLSINFLVIILIYSIFCLDNPHDDN